MKAKKKKKQSKCPKIKFLKVTQLNFALVGIDRTLATQRYPMNGRLLMTFLVLNAILICSVMYIIYEADTFKAYLESVYITFATILITGVFIIIILKSHEMFEFMENIESFINTREYRFGKNIKERSCDISVSRTFLAY